MRKIVFMFVVLGFAGPVSAQVVNHYSSKEACLTGKGFYEPATKGTRKLATGEMIFRFERGGCADMVLPEDLGKRGWVRLAPGDRLVVNKADGKVKRHAGCDNQIFEFVEFPELAPTPLPAPISDSVRNVDFGPLAGTIGHAVGGLIDLNLQGRIENQTITPKPEQRGWWSRNWKWLVPVVAGTAVGGGYLGHRLYQDWDRDSGMSLVTNIVIR